VPLQESDVQSGNGEDTNGRDATSKNQFLLWSLNLNRRHCPRLW
jgi:hypothetical protein